MMKIYWCMMVVCLPLVAAQKEAQSKLQTASDGQSPTSSSLAAKTLLDNIASGRVVLDQQALTRSFAILTQQGFEDLVSQYTTSSPRALTGQVRPFQGFGKKKG